MIGVPRDPVWSTSASLGLALLFILLGLFGVPLLLPQLALEPRVEYVVNYYLLAMACGICPFK